MFSRKPKGWNKEAGKIHSSFQSTNAKGQTQLSNFKGLALHLWKFLFLRDENPANLWLRQNLFQQILASDLKEIFTTTGLSAEIKYYANCANIQLIRWDTLQYQNHSWQFKVVLLLNSVGVVSPNSDCVFVSAFYASSLALLEAPRSHLGLRSKQLTYAAIQPETMLWYMMQKFKKKTNVLNYMLSCFVDAYVSMSR